MLTDKEIKTLNLILEDISYENYFFKKVKNPKWFYPLKDKGFFSPSKAPTPKPADKEGYFIIPEWNVLPYLERISKQVNIPGNERYIDELLAIIKEVSNYKDPDGKHIDNYRTWYYFTKILVNLPTDKISEEILNLIPIWLDSKFSTMLPGSEISKNLLTRFLDSDNPEDWKKAEKIVEIITDIKWVPIPVNQRSLRERDVEARTLIEPHWLKKGFEKSFDKIGAVCSIRVIEKLAKKLLRIFSKQYSHGYDIDFEGKKYEITHMLLKDGSHQILVHSLKYPEDWDGFSRSKIEKTLVKSFIVSDFENRDDFVTKVKEGLIQNAFPSLSTELDEPISSIYNLHDYTYIGYNSLYTSPDHISIDDTEKILIYILKEILAVKAKLDKEETSKILDKFLSKEYPYPFFKRLVLFIAGREWDKYKKYFFRLLSLEEVRWFEESDYARELSILLEDNLGKFNTDEKDIIRKIIEAGPQLLPEENPEKYMAYWKQKWLSIVKDDPLFAPLFEEQKKVTGIEKEKFSFGTEFKTSSGFGPSPLSAEEILNLPNTELATRLKEFRSEKKWEGMTVAAFSKSLKAAVIIKPEKFTESLSSFEDSGFIYIYKILDGLRDSWKAKKTIEWGKIFDFITLYIKKDQFWKDEYIVEPGSWLGGADHEWITGIIAELIQDGTRDDEWAFSEDYFEKAKEIVFLLLDNLKAEEDKEISDYVTYTLNTAFGKVISALILLALRIARVNDKKGLTSDTKWTPEFKEKYEEILKKKIIEGFTNLGRYMPNFYYLDKEWVKEKIKSFENEKGSKYWEAFMDGYFSIGRVYDDLYNLMRPHYQYGIDNDYDFKEKHDNEYLIQHISLVYLRGHESIEKQESLFNQIINKFKHEHIKEIINFFWMQRSFLRISSEENEKMRGRIIEFWRYLYEKYKDKDNNILSREDKQILSAASQLAALLPQIDAESYEWLRLSAPYVHEDYNSSFFIEYLDELKDRGERNETAKYIGDIYLKMLEKITPDFDQKHIRSTVEFLYDSGATESAYRICNIYGSRGHEFLRDIYEKYSNKT